MAQIYGPKIITSGLVASYDVGVPKSFPAGSLPVKAGLTLWLDASDSTTFTYSSGSIISQWRDKSGLNNHAGVNGANNTPTKGLSNSRSAVLFTGTSNQSLSCGLVSALEGIPEITVICVGYSTRDNSVFVSKHAGGTGGTWYFARLSSTSVRWMTINSSASRVNMDVTATPGTTAIFSSLYQSSTSLQWSYSNGSSLGSAAQTGNLQVANISLIVGNYSGNDWPVDGAIHEILIFNRTLNIKELKQTHTYLGLKWGLSNVDRTLHDIVANNDSKLGEGTVVNMPRYDYYNGGALAFNGINSYLYLNEGSAIPNFNPDGVGNARSTTSVNVWFKSATINTGASNKMIFSDNCAPEFSLHQVDNTVYGTAYVSAGATIQSDTWYNACWVSDAGTPNNSAATTYLKFYLNGTLANTNSTSTGNGLNDIPFTLGKDPCTAGTNWSGSIGVVQLYNRALTPNEIKQNYEALKPRYFQTIVQSGLTLNLDASNPYSYAGVGTTWYDVSGTGNNSTLSNGPVYSNTNGGIITFDGSDDYVDVTIVNLTTTVTLEFWVKYTNLTSNMIFGFLMYDIYGYSGALGFNTANSDVYGLSSTQVTNLGIVGNWKHMVFVMRSDVSYTNNKIYVNGVSQGLSQVLGSEYSAVRSFNSGNGRISGWRNDSGYKLPGSIGLFRSYNRELSAVEILQNYNATKGIFGL